MSISVLINSIKSKDARIGVIGLGYVGLPLVIRFYQEGFKIIGFDVDAEKVKMLNSGKSYIKHINEEDIVAMANKGFTASKDYSEISNVDAIIICVPTPLDVHNEPDLSYIRNTLDSIKPYLRENQLLVLESTTYPGTTEEEILPFIQSISSNPRPKNQDPTSRFTFGMNFFVGYSPEREDPGNKHFNTKTIPKVVSGETKNCLEVTKTLYDQIVDQTVPVSSPKVAEMTKILENIHRAVNIGLVNELKMVADKMNIDISEVIKAAATKPFGFTPYYPGPGLGGHCIPIDPFYLTWKAKKCGVDTKFIKLAGEVNKKMPSWVVEKLTEVLVTKNKEVNEAKILILGLAYKKNIDDTRESPALELINILTKLGSKVMFSDPYIKEMPITNRYKFLIKSIDITPKNLSLFDAVILVTDHDEFNYDMITKYSDVVIDTRAKLIKSVNVWNA